MSALGSLAVSLPLKGVDARAGIEIAQEAARRGFTECWVSEGQGPDAFTTLGALAVQTDLRLGVAVVPAQTRAAFVLGMSAVSLADLSGDRFTLGIGSSSAVIVNQWGGQPFDKPLTAVREAVEALRPMLRGERSTMDGEVISINGYKPHTVPARRVPLVVAALNPRSCRVVGELGVDGVALNQLGPRHVRPVLEQVAVGAGGSLPADYRVVARVFCAVTDRPSAARHRVRSMLAPYIATRVYNQFYRWLGHEDVAEAVLSAKGDPAAMANAVTDELVDELTCIGTADEVAAKVAAYVDAGVTLPVVQPLESGREEAERTLWELASVWPG